MSRLIDADALMRKAQRVAVEAWKMKTTASIETILNQFIDWIKSAPTIDAVSVVRCKDCKHWHDHITTTWCSRGAELRPQESGWIKRNADDFCSYGERKETDHE